MICSSRRRALAGALTLAFGFSVLWLAGVLRQPDATSRGPNGSQVTLQEPRILSGSKAPASVPSVGGLAPDFEFSSFDGRRLRLSNYRGKPVVINFWASWCPPCRRELPALEEVAQEVDVEVIAVNFGEDLDRASRLVDDLAVDSPIFGYDPNLAIARTYRVYGVPTTYFVDAQGRITDVAATALELSSLRVYIRNAMENDGGSR